MADLSEVERAVLTSLTNLAFYAQDLAKLFHAFYRDCRVLPGKDDDVAEDAAPETEAVPSEARPPGRNQIGLGPRLASTPESMTAGS